MIKTKFVFLGDVTNTQLLRVLVAFIELQLFAVEAKRTYVDKAKRKYMHPSMDTSCGVCSGILHTPSAPYHPLRGAERGIVIKLMVRAPSFSGTNWCPVRSPYPNLDPYEAYRSGDAFSKWGDHPYADNRRQLIAECIQTLQEELTARGYDDV